LLIRGFDPLNDAIQYGQELLPLVHAEVVRRDRLAAAQAEAKTAAGADPRTGVAAGRAR
jgi:alkanesulfonate monooxygenase